MENNIISIILPTRGRPEVLLKSLKTVIEKASKPERVEILLGIDEDDPETKDMLQGPLADYLKDKNVECRASIFKPLGYTQLHTYVNTLASGAKGQWIFFWNDDGLMVSDAWDEIIDQYNGQFKLLAPTDNHDGHPYAIFPIVPRDWFMLMDHLSMNAQNDTWLSHIAYMLDIFERIELEFIHDRADITGNNNDETFKNREYKEGNPEDPEDFGHVNMQQARVRSAYKIAWYLDKIGQKSEWWEQVQAGKQDPFEKMKANTKPTMKGAGQLAAVNEEQEKKKLDDSETISL